MQIKSEIKEVMYPTVNERKERIGRTLTILIHNKKKIACLVMIIAMLFSNNVYGDYVPGPTICYVATVVEPPPPTKLNVIRVLLMSGEVVLLIVNILLIIDFFIYKHDYKKAEDEKKKERISSSIKYLKVVIAFNIVFILLFHVIGMILEKL